MPCGWLRPRFLDCRRPNRQQTRGRTLSSFYADDLGFGDVGCYGANDVHTPHMDQLAKGGLRFTDAHSSAATCTPSRYSLLTGEYAFRLPKARILPGDAPLIIDTTKPTVASLLKTAGYTAGCVGKWHLGLGRGDVNWNTTIAPGPNEIGFDYSFLIPATGDRVPTVYVENGHVVNFDPEDPITVSYGKPIGEEPSGKERPDLLKMKFSHGHADTIVNGISRIGFMTGGQKARWVDEEMADEITGKAVNFIKQNASKPFFLYFATHDIHVPRVPHARFVNSTTMGPRGDVISEFDWSVGEIVKVLAEQGLTENTLLIVTSDNGPVIDDGYQDQAVSRLGEHHAAGPLRGGKYSPFEGGTRVPFIASWPGRISPGTSDALISQVDLLASFAALTDQALPPAAGPDSQNLLPALLGKAKQGRETFVEQANVLTLRQGNWKYIPVGANRAKPSSFPYDGPGPKPQLYQLGADLGEQQNLIEEHPKVAREMELLLKEIERERTRSAK